MNDRRLLLVVTWSSVIIILQWKAITHTKIMHLTPSLRNTITVSLRTTGKAMSVFSMPHASVWCRGRKKQYNTVGGAWGESLFYPHLASKSGRRSSGPLTQLLLRWNVVSAGLMDGWPKTVWWKSSWETRSFGVVHSRTHLTSSWLVHIQSIMVFFAILL